MNTPTIKTVIGQNIRKLRQRRGYTLVMLASALSISYQQLQKYEKGRDSISGEKLVRIADILDCTVNDLCFLSPTAAHSDASLQHLIHAFERIHCQLTRQSICHIINKLAYPA